MNINLIELNTKGRVDFDEQVNLDGYQNESIKRIDDIRVKGSILDNGTDEYEVKLSILGHITLKSARNGDDVPFKVDIKYDEFENNLVENYKNSSNTLDILPIIWENILLEIPIRAVNENDDFPVTEGEGWEILDSE